MIKFLKKFGLGLAALAVSALPMLSARAADFDATNTQSMFNTAFSVGSSTLAYGIPILLGVVVGVWAIFWLIGKGKKHIK